MSSSSFVWYCLLYNLYAIPRHNSCFTARVSVSLRPTFPHCSKQYHNVHYDTEMGAIMKMGSIMNIIMILFSDVAGA